MDDSLVIKFNGGGMMQNDDLSFKVVETSGREGLVEHDHALSESCALQSILLDHALDGEADGLASVCFFYRQSFVVDRLYLHWLEQS